MKLIREEIEKVEVLTEGTGKNQKLYITGPFLQSECVNRNGRMYPFSIMEREVKRYNEQYVQKGRALGELGHPDGPTVNLDRVSHKIVSLTCEGRIGSERHKFFPLLWEKLQSHFLEME
jgi:hypothetical protein